jgi:hypothetical protein
MEAIRGHKKAALDLSTYSHKYTPPGKVLEAIRGHKKSSTRPLHICTQIHIARYPVVLEAIRGHRKEAPHGSIVHQLPASPRTHTKFHHQV